MKGTSAEWMDGKNSVARKKRHTKPSSTELMPNQASLKNIEGYEDANLKDKNSGRITKPQRRFRHLVRTADTENVFFKLCYYKSKL